MLRVDIAEAARRQPHERPGDYASTRPPRGVATTAAGVVNRWRGPPLRFGRSGDTPATVADETGCRTDARVRPVVNGTGIDHDPTRAGRDRGHARATYRPRQTRAGSHGTNNPAGPAASAGALESGRCDGAGRCRTRPHTFCSRTLGFVMAFPIARSAIDRPYRS